MADMSSAKERYLYELEYIMSENFKRVFAAVIFMAGMFASTGKCDELSELKAQLQLLAAKVEELEKQQQAKDAQIAAQMEKVDAIEKQQLAKDAELSTQIAQVAEQKSEMQIPESLKWAEKVKLSGDFRYRYERIDDDTKSDVQDRNRIRVRVGLDGKVNDDLDFGLRLASGADDPVSTNQTLDSGFSSKDIWIDKAYLDYHGFENTNIIAGKMGNPFVTVGKNQLIWDGDLNPEGGAVKYNYSFDEESSLFANLGGMWVEENGSDLDQGLFGSQAGFVTGIGEGSFTAGMGYFDYANLEDGLTAYNKANGFGNTTVASAGGRSYIYDYNLVEAFASYDFKMGETPVSVYGDLVNNVASGVSEDTGWLVGCSYGKVKDKGSWALSYNYRDLEADAVVGAFCDSDFIGGGTNGKGHSFGFEYGLAKNFSTGITYLMNEKGNAQTDYDRLQVDMQLKF